MLRQLKTFFDKHFNNDEISAEEQQKQLNIAVAALLVEAVLIDNQTESSELERLKNILKTTYQIEQAEIEELISISEQELESSTDYYQFTQLINQHFERTEKLTILKQLWQIAVADGNVDVHEEHYIRKIADLLFIPHSDYIKIKLSITEI